LVILPFLVAVAYQALYGFYRFTAILLFLCILFVGPAYLVSGILCITAVLRHARDY
jgi:hypothetical protein